MESRRGEARARQAGMGYGQRCPTERTELLGARPTTALSSPVIELAAAERASRLWGRLNRKTHTTWFTACSTHAGSRGRAPTDLRQTPGVTTTHGRARHCQSGNRRGLRRGAKAGFCEVPVGAQGAQLLRRGLRRAPFELPLARGASPPAPAHWVVPGLPGPEVCMQCAQAPPGWLGRGAPPLGKRRLPHEAQGNARSGQLMISGQQLVYRTRLKTRCEVPRRGRKHPLGHRGL